MERTIELTQGKLAIVDENVYPVIALSKWHAIRRNKRWYAERREDGESIAMHRFIAGAGPGQIVHHLNGNGLDNRRENLHVYDSAGEHLREHKLKGEKYIRAKLSEFYEGPDIEKMVRAYYETEVINKSE
jgi:hypothetical protein